VRELEGAIENAFAFASSDMIHKSDLPAYITKCIAANKRKSTKAREGMGVSTLFEAEKKLLVQALKAANGNKTRAAQLLGVSRPRLYKMMQRHGIRE
jgi:DNA-binding NtrC family response regulator